MMMLLLSSSYYRGMYDFMMGVVHERRRAHAVSRILNIMPSAKFKVIEND